MSKKNILVAALMVAGIAVSAGASAQTYVAATVGQAKWNVDCSGAATCSTSDTAFKLVGGYNFTQNLAAEAGYFSLGKATASAGNIRGEFKASGVDIVGVLKSTPMNGWVGFAKLGVAYVKGETTGYVGNMSGSTSKNSTQAVAGLGATYQVADNVSVRAEYERRDAKVADFDNAKTTISNLSFGVQYTF
ncbi:outer membrane beta-barrel protein [Undibacterium sp. Jales W-56]|uniref:outer membrane beta-barrel protein n=1 Tax=Undibacterium sp. Jales W-56 TaxID=2897325 RepID=UPI0021D1477B|nr:outer membrane beta-barrel protein [Undibacterium sp. Jales W-56]MCU6434314.1 outer membrane beta-barrel protein [Undibacterium sp. Jales W-56]